MACTMMEILWFGCICWWASGCGTRQTLPWIGLFVPILFVYDSAHDFYCVDVGGAFYMCFFALGSLSRGCYVLVLSVVVSRDTWLSWVSYVFVYVYFRACCVSVSESCVSVVHVAKRRLSCLFLYS